jgi:hypothetical protein
VMGLFDFLTIKSELLRPLSLQYSNCEETSHNLKQMILTIKSELLYSLSAKIHQIL